MAAGSSVPVLPAAFTGVFIAKVRTLLQLLLQNYCYYWRLYCSVLFLLHISSHESLVGKVEFS